MAVPFHVFVGAPKLVLTTLFFLSMKKMHLENYSRTVMRKENHNIPHKTAKAFEGQFITRVAGRFYFIFKQSDFPG